MPVEKKAKQIWPAVLLGLFYLFVFFILLFNSFSYFDPDFGWHLKTGEQIWQIRAVPSLNYEDYTLVGMTWVDHEWLMNLVTYFIFHNFGYITLSVFFALIIIAVLLIQFWLARKFFLPDNRGLIFFLVLQFFGLFGVLPHLGVRMQEVTLLCLSLLLVVIYFYQKDKDYKKLFWLIPLFIFWASAHAGFLIGLFILAFFIFIKIVEFILAKINIWNFIDYQNKLSGKQIGFFAFFSFLAGVATLVTPYGLKLYQFLLGYRDNFYQTHISEWLGEYFYPFQYPQLIYLEIVLLFFVLLVFSVFIFKGERRRKIDLFTLGLVIIFYFLSFKARRHFPLLFVVSLPILANFFINFFKINFNFTSLLAGKNIMANKLIFIFLALALFMAGAETALQINFTNHPESAYQKSYPAKAIDFLRAHPEWNDRKIFNEYGWGGYLIWQYPERKLFIDGRLPQYQFNGHSLLEEYFTFFDPQKSEGKLKEYNIGLVLLRLPEQFPCPHWWERIFLGIKEENLIKAQKENLALHDFLVASVEWQKVYDDGLAEIFIKK
jgi:hypothetical protein